MAELYLYSTSGCHLCEQAVEVLGAILQPYGLVLREVDISESAALMDRYGLRIPVLRLAGADEDLGWPFDAAMASAYLSRQGLTPAGG